MSVIFSGTNQGKFTTSGTAAKTLAIRSGVDWIRSINFDTQESYYWQFGMANGSAFRTAANGAVTVIATGGFYIVDTFINAPININPTTALDIASISAAAVPLVTLAALQVTGSLAVGDIVRLSNVTGGVQLNSIDFTVGAVTLDTSFTLGYMSQIVAATTGKFRKIPYNPAFYPRNRYIVSISQAAQAVVVLTVTHGYKIGQVVSFVVPPIYGMTEINGLQGTILAINTVTNSITVDIDTSAFTTAFIFPTTVLAAAGFTQAQVVPVGMNTAEGLSSGSDILSDATLNTGFIGVTLSYGATSPAGIDTNIIYWTSGNSFSINN